MKHGDRNDVNRGAVDGLYCPKCAVQTIHAFALSRHPRSRVPLRAKRVMERKRWRRLATPDVFVTPILCEHSLEHDTGVLESTRHSRM